MRIVSLAPSCTEILFALGLSDEIVGVTKYCDYPAETELKPKVGGWMDIDFERVLALKPDLVLTSTVVQQKVFEQGRALGLNMLHTDPRSFTDILENILTIGEAVECVEQAEQLVLEIGEQADEIKSKTEHLKRKRVYVEEWPMTVSGNWVPELLEIAGASGFAAGGELSRLTTLSEITSFDPDAIIISWCGFGTRVGLEKITGRNGFKELRAVRDKKVFVIDDTLLNRPGPRILLGAETIAKILHGI